MTTNLCNSTATASSCSCSQIINSVVCQSRDLCTWTCTSNTNCKCDNDAVIIIVIVISVLCALALIVTVACCTTRLGGVHMEILPPSEQAGTVYPSDTGGVLVNAPPNPNLVPRNHREDILVPMEPEWNWSGSPSPPKFYRSGSRGLSVVPDPPFVFDGTTGEMKKLTFKRQQQQAGANRINQRFAAAAEMVNNSSSSSNEPFYQDGDGAIVVQRRNNKGNNGRSKAAGEQGRQNDDGEEEEQEEEDDDDDQDPRDYGVPLPGHRPPSYRVGPTFSRSSVHEPGNLQTPNSFPTLEEHQREQQRGRRTRPQHGGESPAQTSRRIIESSFPIELDYEQEQEEIYGHNLPDRRVVTFDTSPPSSSSSSSKKRRR